MILARVQDKDETPESFILSELLDEKMPTLELMHMHEFQVRLSFPELEGRFLSPLTWRL